MRLLIIFIILTTNLFAQNTQVDSLYITPNGINGYLVLETSGSAEKLHNKTQEWVKYNFDTPEEVMKSSIPGELLRCDMYLERGRMEYSLTIELLFKDDRIKYDVISLKPSTGGYPYFLQGGALDVSFFNNRGKPRNRAEDDRITTDRMMNELAEELVTFIEDESFSDW